MKRIKKVSVTPMSDTTGSIIDSLYSGSNEVTNAPSIRAVKAALGQTFYATTASGSGTAYRYYTITDATLPNEPIDGMTIKVTFPATHSTYLTHIRFNTGQYHQCLVQDLTGAAGTNSYPNIATNRVYELVYHSGSWYFLSAFQKVKSQNIDFATFVDSSTPRVVGYFGDSPIYRKAFSGTTSSGKDTQFSFSTPGEAKIYDHSFFVKSAYEQWWAVPNLHEEAIYAVYMFVNTTSTEVKVNFQTGAAMRSQPFQGFIEYFI